MVGAELAQVYCGLGSQVTLVHRGDRLIVHDDLGDPDAELLVDHDDVWHGEFHDCHSTDMTFTKDTGHTKHGSK